MHLQYERKRVLIWGKTYPELSYDHQETVCTGGSLMDGRPIRLYPVSLRYLPKQQQYKLYDVIDVPMARNLKDPRPESFKVRATEMSVVDALKTDGGSWERRRQVVFANQGWHYECLSDLKRRQQQERHSLGLVRVGEVESVDVKERPDRERRAHEKKLQELSARLSLFDDAAQKSLEFFPYTIHLSWRCARLDGPSACPGHRGLVMDWGVVQLARREGIEMARARLEDLSDLGTYDLRLFMGNYFQHQQHFGIVGLWYPKHALSSQGNLFDPVTGS